MLNGNRAAIEKRSYGQWLLKSDRTSFRMNLNWPAHGCRTPGSWLVEIVDKRFADRLMWTMAHHSDLSLFIMSQTGTYADDHHLIACFLFILTYNKNKDSGNFVSLFQVGGIL
jgi:hypothetical protein